jgi:predicted nucleic acid-binding protein
MILLDTNVLIYASDKSAPHHDWARRTIAEAVASEGAAIDAVSLAEICVGEKDPGTAAQRIRNWGVEILNVPAAAAEVCAKAYRVYRERRLAQSGKESPSMPLPDFFIGAHAQIMGWPLATADDGRIRIYFPAIVLRLPPAAR